MTLDELRDEFDWMFEFQSRMAERIRGDADVHNLVDYVGKLESENAKLRECCVYYDRDNNTCGYYDPISHRLEAENAKLRELVRKVEHYECVGCDECPYEDSCDAGTLYDEECAMSREIEREKGELVVDE